MCHSGETSVDNVLDVHLGTILQHVRLNYLLEREEGGWDANLNWEDILSLGEQQRLGMVSDKIYFICELKYGILSTCIRMP